MLDGAGHVGCEVGKERFGIAKIKPAGDVLRGVVKDHGHIDRQRAEHLVQVIGAVLKVDGVGIERDRPRGVPGQGGDEFGVRRADGVSGWFRTRTCDQRANCVSARNQPGPWGSSVAWVRVGGKLPLLTGSAFT